MTGNVLAASKEAGRCKHPNLYQDGLALELVAVQAHASWCSLCIGR